MKQEPTESELITKGIVAVLMLILAFVVGLCVMIWGWGLTPQSWGWIIGGALFNIVGYALMGFLGKDL